MKLYPSQGKQTIKKKSYPIIHQMLISFMNKKVSGEREMKEVCLTGYLVKTFLIRKYLNRDLRTVRE